MGDGPEPEVEVGAPPKQQLSPVTGWLVWGGGGIDGNYRVITVISGG